MVIFKVGQIYRSPFSPGLLTLIDIGNNLVKYSMAFSESMTSWTAKRSSLEHLITQGRWTLQDNYSDSLIGICQHSWAAYSGFTHRYDYCTKCDEKRLDD